MPQQRPAAERLAELQAKKRKADARLAALENKLKARKHKEDIHRKMILGELMLAGAVKYPKLATWVRFILREELKNPVQLVLFADILKEEEA